MSNYSCAVLTISDKGVVGKRQDTSGPALEEMLRGAGFQVAAIAIVPDEQEAIASTLQNWADNRGIDLLITTGGTGVSPRDVTPEATREILDREIPGIGEAMRAASLRKTPYAALSRGVAGMRGQSLIINLPGSERGATENLETVMAVLEHALEKIKGGTKDCGS